MISDGVGGNALATNTFSIDAVNDKPIRTAGNVSTLYLQEDQEIASMGLDGLTYSVGGGSDEADAQTLSYTITALPDAAIGSVFLADGTTSVTEQQTLTLEQLQGLKFLPALNAAGQVSFSFSVADSGSSDGDGNIINAAESITETVNINILGFNDAPILPVDAITLTDGTEDTAYNFTAADLLAGVTDPDISPAGVKDVDNLQVTGLTATNGTITFNSNTDFTFTPDANFNGIANFNYSISDGTATVSNSVALNIVAVNDAPDATFDVAQITTEGNNALTGTLTSTDIDTRDQAGDTASYSLLSASIADSDGNAITDPTTNEPVAVQGLTINADGSWSFDPADPAYNALAEGEVQTITVNYQVEDAAGLSDSSSFLITLTGTNDAPVATFSTAQNATEDAAAITGQLTSTDPDLKDTVSYRLLGTDIPGLTINTNGAWSFDPADAAYQGLAAGDTQDITVNYSVADNNGATNSSSFVITLTGTNDIPVVDTNAISNLPGRC